jgi:arachidonate 5-lipoxygenase
MATGRQLPSVHPVYKLLASHLQHAIATPSKGRDLLLGEDSVFAKVMAVGDHLPECLKAFYESFRFSQLSLPQDLSTLVVDDADALPNYFYRDDAMRLWAVIYKFVGKILGAYYQSDGDITSDPELQAWIRDIHDNGFPSCGNEKDNGTPSCLVSISQLQDVLTAFIFTASCYHAIVNYSQLDYMAFGPNVPAHMREPAPTRKGEITMEHIMKTLPTKAKHCVQLLIASYLSTYAEHEVKLISFMHS